MMSDMSSDDFEMIESEDIVKQMLVDEKPDLEKIRKWLKPTDYLASSSEFNRHASSKARNTGEWIRETSQFNQWHSSADHGSIWIKAVPGAGKSVLAASMVQSLSANESVPVLFFFFRQIIETNRTSRGILRDWMCQLLPFSEALQLNLFEHVKNKESLESITTAHLWKHLLTGLRMLKRVYCIADALDEMNMDEEFLSQLNALGSFRPGQVKVLLTSRPKQYLQRVFKDPQVIHVSLEEELVKRDISIFVRQRVEQFAEDGINETMQSFIQNTVCERSEGLFLYARLMLDQIAQSIKNKEHSDVSIQEMIAKLPVGLEEMYNRVLIDHASLTKIHRDIQIIILQLITQSARPMRLIEIAKAIQDNPHLAKSGRDAKEIVRSGCGPLLEVMEDGVVQILHHSFTEFLLDSNRITHKLLINSQFPVIEPRNAHREIALLCIGQLQGGAFSSYPISYDAKNGRGNTKKSKRQLFDFGKSFIQYPFVEYAAKKWTYHAKRYDCEDEGFYETLEDFCKPENQAFKAWSTLAGQTTKPVASSEFRRQFDPALASEMTSHLHVASGFGFGCWAQRLLENGADCEMRDSTERTPLFWAAKGGHTEVVKKLLDAGAEPDVDGYDGLKPLHVAASNNHAGVVKLLLGAGVSPLTLRTRHLVGRCGKPLSKLGQHPLMLASSAGHVETIVEMISYCETKELEAALLRAAHHGHHALVSIILEKTDVSPNAQVLVEHADMEILSGQTVLMVATSSLEPKSVKALIEKGGIPSLGSATATNVCSYSFITGRRNMIGLAGRTPLHSLAMATMKQEDRPAAKEILDMLLLAGADLEARDNNGDTPLLLAVSPKSHRYSQIALELLLSAGADPCTRNFDDGTLLHRACTELSSTDLAKQLLAFGANPNQARISDGVTPLHCVVVNRQKPAELIELLVKHGADINAQDINGDTTLHHACRSRSIKPGNLIPTILSFEPDVNIQNNLDETCLHNIYSDLDPELIGAIIDTDMNIELYDRKGMSVLLRAVTRYPYSNIKVVEALLKHRKKASISARTWLQGKTVLHLACHLRNSVELLKVLVSHEADLNWTDSMNGNTLLHEVAARFDGGLEDIALIKYLCESGVSVNAKNYRQQTAAHIMGPAYGNGQRILTIDIKQTFISVVRRLCPELDVNVKDMEGYTPLHYACATSESSVFALIMAGADLNAKSFNRRTLLHCAALGRQCGILSMILNYAQKNGSTIDINAQDMDGMTPLHFACVSGRPESVSILISAGADIDKKTKRATSGATPLMACAMFPEEDQIWKILQRGNSPDLILRDPFRVRPSSSDIMGSMDKETQHITCRIGIIAKMLIKAGADTANSIISARYTKCAELVYVIRGENFTKSKSFAESQLMAPIISTEKALNDCTYEDIDCMKSKVCDLNEITMECMVARGFDFTRADNVLLMRDLGPPIAQFAHYGLTEFMDKIISSAKLFDDPRHTGPIADSFSGGWSVIRPLLHVACERPVWNMDMVKLLIEIGQVDINARHVTKKRSIVNMTEELIQGQTALHILAKGDSWWQVEAIQYLGEHGAELDILDAKGRTPLEIASTYPENGSAARENFFRTQCCEALLKLGANPNRVNPEGLTALNKAGSDEETIRTLLKHGADVNRGTKSVLISAIEYGDVRTLQLYLQNGVDPNVPDNSTDSSYRSRCATVNVARKYPIVVAAFPKGPKAYSASIAAEMIRLLLDHGARVDLAVEEGESILHYLFANATSSTLRPFFERPGIDMNTRDKYGRTALLCAISNSTKREGQYPHVTPSKLEKPQPPYVPPYLHLVNSATHGPSLDYLAVDNEGRHIIFYLLSKWTSETAPLFLSIPGVRSLVTQKDNEGYSPLHRVLSDGSMPTTLTDIVSILVNDGGADLLEPDPTSNTALHHLTRRRPYTKPEDSFRVMDQFLSLGGFIDARNDAGMTPLLVYLAGGGGQSRLPWYEEHGTDFKATNNEGTGALHFVAANKPVMHALSENRKEQKKARADLFEALVKKYGCEVLDEDSKGRTALDIAAAVGNEEILKLFQRRK
ncbi:putative ankyrin repeat protein [Botrytis fragariae]|uniref:Putative ankyrin repeat protein n=1 Tax=Botrytis fragariae TaxID=1964551 RepID=A0A8H6B0D1_9HELO|nr:putative ankyrin repeat protein [Botrytis fragariae]KAF5876996.1 putative ankyrin repeat protein [Botrytis fragariae]